MDKREQRKQRNIYILLGLGIVLALTLLVIDRNGLSWFGKVLWAEISWLQWLALALLLVVGDFVASRSKSYSSFSTSVTFTP